VITDGVPVDECEPTLIGRTRACGDRPAPEVSYVAESGSGRVGLPAPGQHRVNRRQQKDGTLQLHAHATGKTVKTFPAASTAEVERRSPCP